MEDQITQLLTKNNVYYKHSGRDYLIHCLNPDHNDNNPSLRIDKDSGIFNCLSCGFRGNIFKYYGVFTNYSSVALKKLRSKLEKLKMDTTGLKIPTGSTPYTREYRGISAKTLKHFEAFTNTKVFDFTDRMVFPIRDINEKIQVFLARHMFSDEGRTKYVNYPRHVKMAPFPAKVSETDSIVLVEGMFDFLNLWDKGIKNAVCTFGTNTLYSDIDKKLLPYKIQGISKVFILYDGDRAGRDAAKKIKPLIENCQLIAEVIHLEDGKDPGGMSQSEVDIIKEYIK